MPVSTNNFQACSPPAMAAIPSNSNRNRSGIQNASHRATVNTSAIINQTQTRPIPVPVNGVSTQRQQVAHSPGHTNGGGGNGNGRHQTETLLASSPTYTSDCDLYPRRMRETLNQTKPSVFVSDPLIDAYSSHRRHSQDQTSPGSFTQNIDLSLYPGAQREIQRMCE